MRPPRTGMEAFEMMPEGTICQLINDVIIMSPAPTTPHFRTHSKIFSALNTYVEAKQLGTVFFAPVDVYLNRENAFQPDIFYVSTQKSDIIKDRGIEGVPDLVIEVLSKGNEKYDLNEKKTIYELAGVEEYWVVDPKTKWCEGFVLENVTYKSLGEGNGEIIIRMFDLPISF